VDITGIFETFTNELFQGMEWDETKNGVVQIEDKEIFDGEEDDEDWWMYPTVPNKVPS